MKKLKNNFATLTTRELVVNLLLWLPAIAGYLYPVLKGSLSFVAFLK